MEMHPVTVPVRPQCLLSVSTGRTRMPHRVNTWLKSESPRIPVLLGQVISGGAGQEAEGTRVEFDYVTGIDTARLTAAIADQFAEKIATARGDLPGMETRFPGSS